MALNVLCIVLIAGLATLYVRQMFYWDQLVFDTGTGHVGLYSHTGQLGLHLVDKSLGTSGISWHVSDAYPDMPHWWWIDWGINPRDVWIAIPLWFLMLLFSIKPTWSFVTWKRRRRRTRNDDDHPLCANCGYDLYGVTSGKCPECGALF